WYLWHWPLMVFAGALTSNSRAAVVIAAIVSFLPALASYRLVENPIRRRQATTRRTVFLAMCCVTASLAAAAVLDTGGRIMDGYRARQPFVATEAEHLDEVWKCNTDVPLGERDMRHCQWGRGSKLAILVGDSTAGQFSEPFIDAAEHGGY